METACDSVGFHFLTSVEIRDPCEPGIAATFSRSERTKHIIRAATSLSGRFENRATRPQSCESALSDWRTLPKLRFKPGEKGTAVAHYTVSNTERNSVPVLLRVPGNLLYIRTNGPNRDHVAAAHW